MTDIHSIEAELQRICQSGQYGTPAYHDAFMRLNAAYAALSEPERETCQDRHIGYTGSADRTQGEMVCTLDAWLRIGPLIVADFPAIGKVTITDMEPVFIGRGQWQWAPRPKSDGPWLEFAEQFQEEWVRLYTTREVALDALSDACLKWARAQVEDDDTPPRGTD